jgi:hypothetical protein
MNKEKQIQIPQKLFIQLVQYFCCEYYEDEERIKEALNTKLDAIVKHELYTQYKTAPTDAEREQARQQYLEKIGLSQDFRW